MRPHHAVVKTDEVEDQNLQLNDFLMFCNVKPVGYKSRLELSCASDDSTKRQYLDCAADAIVATLDILSKENASHLWNGLQRSKLVNDQLNVVSSSLPSEKACLEALAENIRSLAAGTHGDRFYELLGWRGTNKSVNLSQGLLRFGMPLPVFTGSSMVVEPLSCLSAKPAFVSKGIK